MALAEAGGLWLGEYTLAVLVWLYFVLSLLYSVALKHLPVVELLFVASGFVLRALGGAAPPGCRRPAGSSWCAAWARSMVAIAKRFTELAVLGAAGGHAPPGDALVPGQLAAGEPARRLGWNDHRLPALGVWSAWRVDRVLHLVSVVPLAAALVRFDWLTGHRQAKPVEDLISRDRLMIGCELAWLALFAAGLCS